MKCVYCFISFTLDHYLLWFLKDEQCCNQVYAQAGQISNTEGDK